ncbi:MAG: CoA transferase [Myxococcota bacterium]
MGALSGVRVLDLSRILAGPTCAQLLGDLGADVIKVERPGRGDDTRSWGPPFADPEKSAYYLAANRNKRSIAIDFADPRGSDLVRRLAQRSDILLENYRTGGLKKFGLDYPSLRTECPGLVYCSITGFGQTGPRAQQPGYDFLAQAMAGTMSVTGEPAGEPMKVGVGVADIMCGMYASSAVLAALRHRDATGAGQQIDLALFDSTLSWLINAASNYFVSGEAPRRFGNGHPNIVPYQTFEGLDGWLVVACGNDSQFARLCEALERAELAEDPRYEKNAGRLAHRGELIATLASIFRVRSVQDWIARLEEAQVPVGPVNDIPSAFAEPQAVAREMTVELGGQRLVANPLRLSETPVEYRHPPPARGEHTDAVLGEALGLDRSALAALREDHVIE